MTAMTAPQDQNQPLRLTPEQEREAERRLQEYEANSEDTVSLEDVRRRLLENE